MTVAEYLLMRLEGPLQAWGDVAVDPHRPTRPFPSRSALAGLLANALGWTHREAGRVNELQDALQYAVREDRVPSRMIDFQTVDLGAETKGWTHWGVEERGGAFSTGTQILRKEYLVDGSFLVALTVDAGSPVDLDVLEEALDRPARPLFLGRKSCPPATRILEGRVQADAAFEALRQAHARGPVPESGLRCWYSPGDGPTANAAQLQEVWDHRDYVSQRFVGSRSIVEGLVEPAKEESDR